MRFVSKVKKYTIDKKKNLQPYTQSPNKYW